MADSRSRTRGSFGLFVDNLRTDPKDKIKRIRDSVHGYIHIPNSWLEAFVDTFVFQRLRQIEQTSMRVLYPCAHHDRFAHSLGTFHLASLATEAIERNGLPKGLDEGDWRSLANTFLIASLLHDCAHAPFSHTTEDFLDPIEKGEKHLDRELKRLISPLDETFKTDYENASPAAHEKASAVLLLERFAETIRGEPFGGDPILAARMILGCKYREVEPGAIRENVANCLTELLNGSAIDVDKLDYILRDTWASGVSNTLIDVDRLVSAMQIICTDGEQYRLVFRSSAMSVIQNVLSARNYLYRWIYSHHIVKYDTELLIKGIDEALRGLVGSDDIEAAQRDMFSIGALTDGVTIKDRRFYLPTDADVVSLMKEFCSDETPNIQEWMSRKRTRCPLWKTLPEFHRNFKQEKGRSSEIPDENISMILQEGQAALQKEIGPECWLINATPKLAGIIDDQILLLLDSKTISFSEVFGRMHVKSKPWFYVFVPLAQKSKKPEIVSLLKGL